MLAELVDIDDTAQRNRRGAIQKREFCTGLGEVLPDELEHEQLVKVGIEERARDGIEFPIMVVRAPGEVNDHDFYCKAARSPASDWLSR